MNNNSLKIKCSENDSMLSVLAACKHTLKCIPVDDRLTSQNQALIFIENALWQLKSETGNLRLN